MPRYVAFLFSALLILATAQSAAARTRVSINNTTGKGAWVTLYDILGIQISSFCVPAARRHDTSVGKRVAAIQYQMMVGMSCAGSQMGRSRLEYRGGTVNVTIREHGPPLRFTYESS